jgi:hypothetical protein
MEKRETFALPGNSPDSSLVQQVASTLHGIGITQLFKECNWT